MVKWSGPAKNVTQNIVAKTEKLKDFPEIGRVVPEIGDPNVRELYVYSYRLIYEIKSDRVEILAIIHGKRDFLSVGRTELDR